MGFKKLITKTYGELTGKPYCNICEKYADAIELAERKDKKICINCGNFV